MKCIKVVALSSQEDGTEGLHVSGSEDTNMSSVSTPSASVPGYLEDRISALQAVAQERSLAELRSCRLLLNHVSVGMGEHMSLALNLDPSIEIPEGYFRLTESLTNLATSRLYSRVGILGGIRDMSVYKRVAEIVSSSPEVSSRISGWYAEHVAVIERAIQYASNFVIATGGVLPYIDEHYIVDMTTNMPRELLEEIDTIASALIRVFTTNGLVSSSWGLVPDIVIPETTMRSMETAEVRAYFRRIKAIACSPQLILTNPGIRQKVRALGTEIFDSEDSLRGLNAVCEFNREYCPYLRRVWGDVCE